ncbi:MAG: hypothetical protein EPO51_08725 [Phenylobacterium sp.]|uniref:hypothetical protein n=1 Tax=Phenylobacterium sp. TaxID=1871053 RepID=UPI0011FC1ED9|nr:hypothetical protein [Phenylobacterium sp.]TAJ72186.1 MAG: hypothetical protein EPO51_08725 [Phenylobacterium sp.]
MKRLLAAAVPMRLRGRFRRLHPDHAIAARAFDAAFYLRTYPDVGEVGADPLDHFMTYGWREGRDPSPDFSVRTYLEAFPEVAESAANPFVHWITSGRPRAVQAESPYGFRYDLIARLKPVEARLPPGFDGVVGGEADLSAALARSRGGLASLHLTFSHDDYSANLGGLQFAIQREAARLAELGRDHLHLYPAQPWPVVRTAADPGVLGVVWNGEALGLFTPAGIARALAAAAGADASGRSFAIHSLLGHAADETADILAAVGLTRGVFWLHDFASLCAGFHLLRNDVEDCAAPPPDSAACGVCVYGPWRGRHLAEHARLFERLELTVAAPSRATLDLWSASTALPAAGAVVLPHAVLEAREPAPAAPDGRPLRIAYAGLPVAHKGWPIFRTLATRFADDPRYEFHHLGARGDATLPAAFQPVSAGAAQPLAMRDALQATGIDAVLVWPLCRETFSFVAYEAVAAGCAVITGPDSGNVAAFVVETGHGRVLDEAALTGAFESGAVLELGRARRAPMLYDLRYSALTLDLAAAASE